jgi:hypothetical protein
MIRLLAVALLLVASALPLQAETPTPTPEPTLEPETQPGETSAAVATDPTADPAPPTEQEETPAASPLPPQSVAISDVAVPVPRQIFETLDRFRDSNWRYVQRGDLTRAQPTGDQPTLALLLGATIAEGFISVGAEDAEAARQVGRTILRMARGLGVREAALRRSRSIGERVDAGDWAAVRAEWDGVLNDVDDGMKQLRSDELAPLVSLGGWLRGAEALAGLIAQHYTPENAELLRQPALIEQFDAQLKAIRGATAGKPVVKRLRAGLAQIRALTAPEVTEISQDQVRQIGGVAGKLVDEIVRPPKPATRGPRRR